jgi:hypothetical protein
MPLTAFNDLARRAFIDVALNEMSIPGRRPSVARAALLTGLTRKDVQRVIDAPAPPDDQVAHGHNRAARVVTGWLRDVKFRDDSGEPLPLPLDDGPISFAALVRRYSGDVTPRAVLDELERVGTVERRPDGLLRLRERGYIPRASDIGKLHILGTDVSLLIGTIDHNLHGGGQPPRFQRKVMYDNLPREVVEEFRALVAQHGQHLLERIDLLLARHDRDVNPMSRGTGRIRLGVGVFSFEEDLGVSPDPDKASAGGRS